MKAAIYPFRTFHSSVFQVRIEKHGDSILSEFFNFNKSLTERHSEVLDFCRDFPIWFNKTITELFPLQGDLNEKN